MSMVCGEGVVVCVCVCVFVCLFVIDVRVRVYVGNVCVYIVYMCECGYVCALYV